MPNVARALGLLSTEPFHLYCSHGAFMEVALGPELPTTVQTFPTAGVPKFKLISVQPLFPAPGALNFKFCLRLGGIVGSINDVTLSAVSHAAKLLDFAALEAGNEKEKLLGATVVQTSSVFVFHPNFAPAQYSNFKFIGNVNNSLSEAFSNRARP